MKELLGKFRLAAWMAAVLLAGVTLTACGGDDDDEDIPGNNTEVKGKVFTFEVYLEGDADKFGIDGDIFAYDKGNGHGKFVTTGDVVLDNYPNDGFVDVLNGSIAGYTRSFGNKYGMSSRDHPTASKHFSISSEPGCEKMRISLQIFSNYMLKYQFPEIEDVNAELRVRIVGYADGKLIKDNTAVFKHTHMGDISVGLEGKSDGEGYSYLDGITNEYREINW